MSDGESVNLLVVTQFFPPESMGGAHRWEKISTNLDDSIDPHVLCTFPTYPFGEFDQRWRPIERDSVGDVPVTRLFTYQPMADSTIGRILNYGIFALLSSLYVLATFWRYDCIVTMSTPHTTFLPGLVGKLTGRKWIIDIFDLWIDNAADLGYVNEESILYRAVSWLEYVSFARADVIFVITETMKGIYEEKYDHLDLDIQVIPFGVDTELFFPSVPGTIETDVIYTGNLGTGQAFVPFLEGFAEVEGEPELTIVGDGERRDELEALISRLGISERVQFIGYVDRVEIPELVSGAAVSLVPLKTDYQLDYARPTKLLETMAVGTPYVASDVSEIAELSERYDTGIAVENRAVAVQEALETLLSDSRDCKRMGANGTELIETHHDWMEIGTQVSEAVRS